jgi:hypothetical protein
LGVLLSHWWEGLRCPLLPRAAGFPQPGVPPLSNPTHCFALSESDDRAALQDRAICFLPRRVRERGSVSSLGGAAEATRQSATGPEGKTTKRLSTLQRKRTKHDLKHARTTELGEANRIDSTSGHFPPKPPCLTGQSGPTRAQSGPPGCALLCRNMPRKKLS